MNRRRAAFAAIAVLTSSACGGASSEAGSEAQPIWTRPGYEAHVRPEWGPPQPGDRAPEIALPGAGGTAYRLSDDAGKIVVVHFTTTWCPYCDEEVEHLDRLAARYDGRGVRVLLIDVLEEPEVWWRYLEGRLPHGKVLPLIDESGDVARSYAPPGALTAFANRAHVVLASTIIVDAEGIVRFFLMPDSRDFDPTFRVVYEELDRMLGARASR